MSFPLEDHDCDFPTSQSHTAHKLQEIHIYYKFHPLYRDQVNTIGHTKVRGEFHYLIELSDGSRIYIPSWMTHPESSQFQIRRIPRIKLKKEGKINAAVIENMLSWHHSGFHVYIGSRIWPDDKNGLENLARYIVRACFSQQRLVYIPVEKSADGVAKVIYTSKDGRAKKAFDALDWLALLVTHIPARYEQTVRYYGFYSNKSSGLRKKTAADEQLSSIIPAEMSSKAFRRNWARLIQKIHEVDPLVCPKCQAVMKIIAFIEQKQVIEKILRHLKMSDIHNHDPPRNSPYISELTYDDSHCQIPAYDDWL
jgi:Putative transposase